MPVPFDDSDPFAGSLEGFQRGLQLAQQKRQEALQAQHLALMNQGQQRQYDALLETMRHNRASEDALSSYRNEALRISRGNLDRQNDAEAEKEKRQAALDQQKADDDLKKPYYDQMGKLGQRGWGSAPDLMADIQSRIESLPAARDDETMIFPEGMTTTYNPNTKQMSSTVSGDTISRLAQRRGEITGLMRYAGGEVGKDLREEALIKHPGKTGGGVDAGQRQLRAMVDRSLRDVETKLIKLKTPNVLDQMMTKNHPEYDTARQNAIRELEAKRDLLRERAKAMGLPIVEGGGVAGSSSSNDDSDDDFNEEDYRSQAEDLGDEAVPTAPGPMPEKTVTLYDASGAPHAVPVSRVDEALNDIPTDRLYRVPPRK